jgi:putative flippase GtrA
MFIKYAWISAIALLVDYTAYLMLVSNSLANIPESAVLGYLTGLVVAYYLLKKTIFRNGWLRHRRLFELLLFGTSGMLGVVVTFVVSSVVLGLLGERVHLTKLAAVAVSFLTVYAYRRLVVFRIPSIR